MTDLTKLIELQGASSKYVEIDAIDEDVDFYAACRNFDFAALDAKIKRYEEALRLIACRPLGGKTEDYLCASGLQQLARKALEQ